MRARTSPFIASALIVWLGSVGAAIGDTPDQLSLSPLDKNVIALGAVAEAQAAPSGFQPSVGAVVPKSLSVYALDVKVKGLVPAVDQYDYVKLPNQDVLLVDPKSRKVVAMIDRKEAEQSYLKSLPGRK